MNLNTITKAHFFSYWWVCTSAQYIIDHMCYENHESVNNSILVLNIYSFQPRRDVGSQSLFYHFFNDQCFEELNTIIPSPLERKWVTRSMWSQSTDVHSQLLFVAHYLLRISLELDLSYWIKFDVWINLNYFDTFI